MVATRLPQRVCPLQRGLPVQAPCSAHRCFRRNRQRSLQLCSSCGPIERDIRLIATDVDGTLLTADQELTPRVERAVKQAVDLGIPVVVATGKPRGPWAKRVLPKLGPRVAGVFMQGLIVYDTDGRVIHSRQLDAQLGLEGLELAEKYDLTFAAYCGERVLANRLDRWTDFLIRYQEPEPEHTPELKDMFDELEMQKYILMADEKHIEEIRPAIERQFSGRASLTVALPGLLEVLPLGASKGAGVERLLRELRVDPGHVMALGDGENDVEMFELVGLGVAMGNAVQALKDVADEVLEVTHNEDAVAVAIEKYVLEPRGAMTASS